MLKRKLLSRRGETLAELLVAVLVCGVSIMLLANLIITSMKINNQARQADVGTDGHGGFYGGLSDVEKHTLTVADDSCAVTLEGSGSLPDINVAARSYTNSDAGLTVYGEVTP